MIPHATAFKLDVTISPGDLTKDSALISEVPSNAEIVLTSEGDHEALLTVRALVSGVELEALLEHMSSLSAQLGVTSMDIAPTATGGWWVELEYSDQVQQDLSTLDQAISVLRDNLIRFGLDSSSVAAQSYLEKPYLAATPEVIPIAGSTILPGCKALFAVAAVVDKEAEYDNVSSEALELETSTMTAEEQQKLAEEIQEYLHYQDQILVVLKATWLKDNQEESERYIRQLIQQLQEHSYTANLARFSNDSNEPTVYFPVRHKENSWFSQAHFTIDTPTTSPRAIATALTAALPDDMGQLTPHLTSGHVYCLWQPGNPATLQGVERLSLHVVRGKALSQEIFWQQKAAAQDDSYPLFHGWLQNLP